MSTDPNKYKHWLAFLNDASKGPAYKVIPDLIAEDINRGLLNARDKLPPLRTMARLLSLNYTTVARAYQEASKRGLIDSQPGLGSFIKGYSNTQPLRNGSQVEMTMNHPPEPDDPQLIANIKMCFDRLKTHEDFYFAMRYQDFGGSIIDKEAGIKFLSPLIPQADIDRLLVCPGIHSALVALLTMLVGKNKTLCVQGLVYPGLKAIAAQLGITLYAIASDADGPIIRLLEDALQTKNVGALYINPTIQNPTTHTLSLSRREAIADLALHYSVPVIEDDPYGLLPQQKIPPIATLAPEITYYINGLSKCFCPGIRTAYLYTPSKRLAQRTSGALRSLSVMASPMTTSIASHIVNNQLIDAMLIASRQESSRRLAFTKKHLAGFRFSAHDDGFHLWLTLPKSIDANPSAVAAHLRANNISAVSSAAFCTDNNPPDAIRLCLGGSISYSDYQESIILLSDILQHPAYLSGIAL